MLPILCSSCGELLGNKQLVYEEGMRKICEKYNIDYDMYSQGIISSNEDINREQAELILSLAPNYCCLTAIKTYVRVVDIIVGKM